MLCEQCGKKTATVYYKQTINGQSREYHLCSDCAEALRKQSGGHHALFPFPSFFGEEDLFSPSSLFASSEGEKKPKTVKTCPLCGSRFSELVNTGKLGCADCYKTFSEELDKTLLSIHGRASHVGRRPKSKTASASVPKPAEAPTDPLAALRADLQKAIAEERYEDAAVVRDKLRQAETERNERSGQ